MKPHVPSFPAILAIMSSESCSETTSLKTKYFLQNTLNLEKIFSHSRKTSLTFNKFLSSKRLATHDRPSEHVSVTFDPASHEESNTSYISSFEIQSPPDSKFTSTSKPPFEIDFDHVDFKAHILHVTSIIRDDFSCSSHSSHLSCSSAPSYFSSYHQIKDMIMPTSKLLDKKLEEILASYSDISSSIFILSSKSSSSLKTKTHRPSRTHF